MTANIQIIRGSCPLCRSTQADLLLDGLRDVENRVPGEYAISRCRECQLIYLSTRPDESSLPMCYDANYHIRFDRGRNPLIRSLFNVRYSLRLRRLLQHNGGKPPATLLEIGCGDGQFLLFMEHALPSTELVGVELDTRHIHLPPSSRVQIFEADFDRVNLGRQFDAVVMYHVLEHLPHPIQTLRRIRNLLKPGGFILLQVPDWNTIWRRVFPRHWNGLQIPRHQFFLDAESLREVCCRGGFRVERLAWLTDPGDFAVSACNWITDCLRLKTLPRQAWFYLPLVFIGVGVVFLSNQIFGHSGELEVLARPAEEV